MNPFEAACLSFCSHAKSRSGNENNFIRQTRFLIFCKQSYIKNVFDKLFKTISTSVGFNSFAKVIKIAFYLILLDFQ